MDDGQVTFSYKNYRENKSGIMKLHCTEFIRRFLMHVLPKGLMRIRHYGLLSNRCRKTSLTIIRKALTKPIELKGKEENDEASVYTCAKCKKGHLVFMKKIDPVLPLSRWVPG